MGNYAAFNVTHYCGDAPERVKRNRAWLCNQLGIRDEHLILPHQTHTDNVLAITPSFLALASDEQQEQLENIDALITNVEGVCIGVSTADCIPVLVYDPIHHASAAIHSGWRGTVKRISQNALREMAHQYGTKAADCQVVIGPGIGTEAFEVGEEVAQQFQEAQFPSSVVQSANAHRPKPHIDLVAANVFLLEEIGVELEHIQVSGICTYTACNTFFSARRLGINSGRIFSAILLGK